MIAEPTRSGKNRENPVGTASKQTEARKEPGAPPKRTLCDYFGATPTLPKIKKIDQRGTSDQTVPIRIQDNVQEMSDEVKAEKLKELYARIEEIEKLKNESQVIVNSLKNARLNGEVKSLQITASNTSVSEGGLKFDFAKTPDSKSFSLPAYFHKNMQQLQGNLPLTIFNRAWQQAASDNHVDYRKQDKEVEKYRGLPYPGEWTQSRFEWSENFDNFISTCRDTYNYNSFADALETHKRNVTTIFKQQRSWVVAFRYDL